MSGQSIEQMMRIAVQRHQTGELGQAEALYRDVLSRDANEINALSLLGRLLTQTGRYDEAIELLQRVVARTPDSADAHFNLGAAWHSRGTLNPAKASYERALQFDPNLARAYANLGGIYFSSGLFDEAVAHYQRAIQLEPNSADWHYDLAGAFIEQSRLVEADASLRRAIALRVDCADAYLRLGNVLAELGQRDSAAICFQRVLAIEPASAQGLNNLGNIQVLQGDIGKVRANFQRAIQLQPDFADAHYNLGNLLRAAGDTETAILAFERAATLAPNNADAHNNLGMLLKDKGEIPRALACVQRAIDVKPDFHAAHSNLLLVSHYDPALSSAEIYERHLAWNRQHAEPLKRFIAAHANDRSSDRPLRIGYVSPDFRQHSVAHFALPLLEAHDRNGFHVICYHTHERQDAVTERFRAAAREWRNISQMSDEAAAGLVRRDQIDILVDLAGHTAGNRLLLFARKPAPVQVTWLGYPNTTGVDAIDYRFTDEKADPSGATDRWHSEKLIRLPDTAWCYSPLSASLDVQPLPAQINGLVTFGSLHGRPKLSIPVLEIWAKLLNEVSGSRLLIKNPGTANSVVRDGLIRFFSAHGIGGERLMVVPPEVCADKQLETRKHLQAYDHVDIALDTYPYHGTTITCEASWLGVPTVTLAGPAHVSRVGVSLLSTVGLGDLIADSPEEYVRIATALANDLPRLAEIRATLRQQMQQSPLMNTSHFARNVEKAFRDMWRDWCDKTQQVQIEERPT